MGPRDTWDRLGAWLRGLGAALDPRPRAVLVVSAHWEAPTVRVTGAARPSLIYDYYGFPPHTYALRYDAPGAPDLAANVASLLNAAGIAAGTDPGRGFDHGVFVPLKLVFPLADVPVVQVSLLATLDPGAHLAVGRALQPLRDRGVLILGSGMSYHNLAQMMSGATSIAASDMFDDWLARTCLLPAPARERALLDWHEAPAARAAHPREEHLIPLMVVAGAAGDAAGACAFRDRVMGSTVSAFRFDA